MRSPEDNVPILLTCPEGACMVSLACASYVTECRGMDVNSAFLSWDTKWWLKVSSGYLASLVHVLGRW